MSTPSWTRSLLSFLIPPYLFLIFHVQGSANFLGKYNLQSKIDSIKFKLKNISIWFKNYTKKVKHFKKISFTLPHFNSNSLNSLSFLSFGLLILLVVLASSALARLVFGVAGCSSVAFPALSVASLLTYFFLLCPCSILLCDAA